MSVLEPEPEIEPGPEVEHETERQPSSVEKDLEETSIARANSPATHPPGPFREIEIAASPKVAATKADRAKRSLFIDKKKSTAASGRQPQVDSSNNRWKRVATEQTDSINSSASNQKGRKKRRIDEQRP